MLFEKEYVVVRGAGDLATGIIQKLFRAGFKVIAVETEKPSAIRRTVSLSEAVYEGKAVVEDIIAKRIEFSMKNIEQCHLNDFVPVIIDPFAECVKEIRPLALVDAIMTKKNNETNLSMADIVIGLGPGFSAPNNVNAVIETARGHNLGRLILNGEALKNTGISGEIGGITHERVIYAQAEGHITNLALIGDTVNEGQEIAKIGDCIVKASISGVLRGLIRDSYYVKPGFKIADIDPRITETYNCHTISDKARCLGGAVLEAIFYLLKG